MLAKNCTVIKGWLVLGLMCISLQAYAGPAVGTVTDLSGPLLAKKSDGTVKVLSTKSSVEQGDVLVTEKDTYARIKFTDNSEVTLRPNTQFKIDSFAYADDKPQEDSSVFSLIKGGLRAVTGAMGKRSREKVGVNTPAATIGIRGTTYIAEYVSESDGDVAMLATGSIGAAAAGGEASRAPGLYVSVLDGMVQLTNRGGTQNFAAGQFGFTGGINIPPVILPANPGMQFTPPAKFSAVVGGQGGSSGNAQQNNADCEVR